MYSPLFFQDMVNKHLGLKFENVFPPPEGSNLQKGDVAVLRNVLYCDFMTQVCVVAMIVAEVKQILGSLLIFYKRAPDT